VNISVKSLRCPDCGNPLEGLDKDLVFFCRRCRIGYESIEEKGWKKLRVSVHAPDGFQPGGSVLWLPMWAMKVQPSVEAPPKEKEHAERILKDLQWVWVTGFRTWRPSYFGDPGLLYTSKSIKPEFESPAEETMPSGCAVRTGEAVEFPVPFLLSIVDRHVDVAPIEISVKITEGRLASVPFMDMGAEIVDMNIEWKWPAIFVEDIETIREAGR